MQSDRRAQIGLQVHIVAQTMRESEAMLMALHIGSIPLYSEGAQTLIERGSFKWMRNMGQIQHLDHLKLAYLSPAYNIW